MLDMCGLNAKNVRHGWCRFQVKVAGLHGKDYIAVIGSHPMLGKWDVEEAIPLKPVNQGDNTMWTGDAELAGGEASDYKYVILRTNEWEPLDDDRCFYTALDGKLTTVHDQFGVKPSTHPTPPSGVARKGVAALCNFQLKLPGLSDRDGVAIVGNQDWLGSWQVQRAVPMDRVNPDTFSVTVHLPAGELIKYKYVILHEPQWEGLHIHRTVAVAAGGLTLTADAFDEAFHPMGVRCPPLLATAAGGNSGGGHGGASQVRFEVTSKFLGDDEHIGLLGSHEMLGAWDELGARPLERVSGDGRGGDSVWATTVELPTGQQMDYKYVVLPSVRWEPLENNRELSTASAAYAPMRQRDRSGVITPPSNHHPLPAASPVRPPSGKRSTSPASLEDLEHRTHLDAHHHHQQQHHHHHPPSPHSATEGAGMDSGRKRCSFRVEVEGKLGRRDRVLVCGSDPSLGGWEVPRAMHLLRSPGDARVWLGSETVEGGRVAYKYLVERRGKGHGEEAKLEWERRGDRMLDADVGHEGVLTVSDKMESPMPPPEEGDEEEERSSSLPAMSSDRSPPRASPGQVVMVEAESHESSVEIGELLEGEFAWVEDVMAGSPAAEAGLRVGDRLLEVGGASIREVEARGLSAVNEEVLRAAEHNAAVMVKIVREADMVEGGHGGWRVLKLTPKRWAGEGLIGCRLARGH